MKLEQVLPILRDGQCITRQRKINNDTAMIYFVRIIDNKLKFMVLTSKGDKIPWAYYSFQTEDITVDNWEVAG